jgi:hypothetical protein
MIDYCLLTKSKTSAKTISHHHTTIQIKTLSMVSEMLFPHTYPILCHFSINSIGITQLL